jgi:hypothetical protein
MKFFSKIYEIPRAGAARVLCVSFLPLNSTVHRRDRNAGSQQRRSKASFKGRRAVDRHDACTHTTILRYRHVFRVQQLGRRIEL